MNERTIYIGPYRIYPCPNNSKNVWIRNGDGEGGSFSRAGFVAACEAGEAADDLLGYVDRYFWENF